MVTTGDTETDLIERARSGDHQAYRLLVEQHSTRAFRLAYLITRSAEDAEEAAQDGFVKAWKALDRFREGSAFAPWVLHIVRNEAKNRVRSRIRRDRMESRLAVERPQAPTPPDAAALDAMADDRLAAAVGALPDRLRSVIHCVYFLELSETETATVLGIPRGTVKSRAARARSLLAAELEKDA